MGSAGTGVFPRLLTVHCNACTTRLTRWARRANPGVYEGLRVRYDALRDHSYAGLSPPPSSPNDTDSQLTPQQEQACAAFGEAQQRIVDIATSFTPIPRDLR